MRVKTVQINWHDKLPIFSVDFDHNYKAASGGWRFASGGGDNNVRIWRLKPQSERDASPQSPAVEFLASLNRHQRPVNIVRFSPVSSTLASAGDDGVIILWRQTEPAGRQNLVEADDGFVEPETWRPVRMLRGSLADICDLAWSPSGRYVVSASVDNTARIWDADDGRCVQVLADHSHYVQGVAWDPSGDFIVTQGSDRSMRVYRWAAAADVRPGADPATLVATHFSMPRADADADEGAVARSQRLFHDDTLASFFRRPSVSPDGCLLATAAGVQREKLRNCSYVWARDRLNAAPSLALGGHAKPVVATRWAPCMFESDNGAGWVAGAGHRMMLAVASQAAVAIYDTYRAAPLGMMSGLHYAMITDLAWTADGSHLLISSIDGFASVASIDQPTPPLPAHRAAVAAAELSVQPEPSVVPGALAVQPAASSKGKKRLAPTLVTTL